MGAKPQSLFRLPLRFLPLIGVLGAVGGAANAWLFWIGWPVAHSVFPGLTQGIIVAGACHGALLALISVGSLPSGWFDHRLPWALGPIFRGWIAGWLSFIPIQPYVLVASNTGWWDGLGNTPDVGWSWGKVAFAVFWPMQDPGGARRPYVHFGCVALLYAGLLQFALPRTSGRLLMHVLFGTVSGVVGSIGWWWFLWQSWDCSVLHGVIWGLLVGAGVWASQQTAATRLEPS